MIPRPVNDEQIRYVLRAINMSNKVDVTTLEAEFLNSAVYNWRGEWSVEQRARAAQIAEKYRHQL